MSKQQFLLIFSYFSKAMSGATFECSALAILQNINVKRVVKTVFKDALEMHNRRLTEWTPLFFMVCRA